MNKVFVEMKSCFGIRDLKQEFNFSKRNAIVVYAPNGAMKTSFAKTLSCVAEGRRKEIKDRVSGKVGSVDIRFDGELVGNRKDNRIYVVNGDDFIDAGQSVANILVDSSLHREYLDVRKELDSAYEELIKQLREVSKDDACELALRKAFHGDSIEEFRLRLAEVCGNLDGKQMFCDFDHRAVFDTKDKVLEFLKENKDLIGPYVRAVKRILNQSPLFGKEGGKIFAFGQAEDLLKTLSQGGYFEIGHKLELKRNQRIGSTADLKKYIDTQKRRFAKDLKRCKEMETLSKLLSANAELRKFRDLLATCPWIASELENYEAFRHKVWKNYLNQLLPVAKAYARCFKTYQERLRTIACRTPQQLDMWREVVDEFNSRFSPPFKVSIANEQDVLQSEGVPAKLQFFYSSDRNNASLPPDALQEILSRGEGRALRIMQVIFELKARMKQNKESLLVFDDVVDSFDYRNKYAMVEYLKDMEACGLFKCIILTHNFDFFRLVSSRLGLEDGRLSLAMFRKNDNKIHLVEKQYNGNALQSWISTCRKNINGARRLIAMIPFVRNMAEYISGNGSHNYLQLTYCLHYRPSECPSISHVVDIFIDVIPTLKNSPWLVDLKMCHDNYYNFLFDVAEKKCLRGADPTNLECKMVLAIAIRIKAEKYIHGLLRRKA